MKKRILVIDDDAGIRKSFTLALEDTGYEVVTVASGYDGLELHKEKRFNLIYLDLKMPVLDGVETLIRLREIDSVVPIYIVTAYHQEYFERLQKAVENNISFELLQKPIDISQICTVTRGILDGPEIITD